MDLLIQLLAFIITILVLVSLHEAGHFFVAKLLGIKVLRYAIGFGKTLFRFRGKSGTEYVFGLIPLGGYVKLLDEREVIVPKSEKALAFNRQALWARTVVVLAGPVVNILFAILGFWLMFMIGIESSRPIIGNVIPNSIAAKAGLQKNDEIQAINGRNMPSLQKVIVTLIERLGETKPMVMVTKNTKTQQVQSSMLDLTNWHVDSLNPDPLKSLGIEPKRPDLPAIIASISPYSPAAQAGLLPKDQILMINGDPIRDWYQLLEYIHYHPGQKMMLTVKRQNNLIILPVVIGKRVRLFAKTSGYLGIKTKNADIPASLLVMRKYPAGMALINATQETWQYLKFNAIVFKKMLIGEISLGALGGPIAIFETANLAFRQGVSVFFGFLALISTMLAFINLLPIPGLDGGHLLNYLIELITGRPVSLRFEAITIKVGFAILFTMMLMATMNDIMRLLSGS